MKKLKLKKLSPLLTDKEAEDFIDHADLSEYDLSGFKPMRFEFQAKSAQINMRLPQQLLNAVKARAGREGMPYQRFIRQTLEQAVTSRSKS